MKPVTELKSAAKVLCDTIGKQVRMQWFGVPTKLVEQLQVFQLAALLDPSVRNNSVFTDAQLASVNKIYKQRVHAVLCRTGKISIEPAVRNVTRVPATAPVQKRPSIMDRMQLEMSGVSPAESSPAQESPVAKEIRLYGELKVRTIAALFKALHAEKGLDAHKALVRSVFTAMASEAGSERVFSRSGRLLGPLRESMGPDMASLWILLHENLQFWPTDKEIMQAFWEEHYAEKVPPLKYLKPQF